MKTAFYSAAIVALSVSAAIASGPEVPMELPVLEPVAAGTDWGGLYFGAFAGLSRGNMWDIGGPWALANDSGSGGFFVGYRHDLGNTVVGVELDQAPALGIRQAAFPGWFFTGITDLRATAGYEFGQALVFGSAGFTTSQFQAGGPVHSYNGWNAGLGVDYMVEDNVFLGAEYVHRSLKSTTTPTWTARFGTVQIRGGIIF